MDFVKHALPGAAKRSSCVSAKSDRGWAAPNLNRFFEPACGFRSECRFELRGLTSGALLAASRWRFLAPGTCHTGRDGDAGIARDHTAIYGLPKLDPGNALAKRSGWKSTGLGTP